jgi:hypothetical protein
MLKLYLASHHFLCHLGPQGLLSRQGIEPVASVWDTLPADKLLSDLM